MFDKHLLWMRKIDEHVNQVESLKVARTIGPKGNNRKKATELINVDCFS
jgi:hypothetical protein